MPSSRLMRGRVEPSGLSAGLLCNSLSRASCHRGCRRGGRRFCTATILNCAGRLCWGVWGVAVVWNRNDINLRGSVVLGYVGVAGLGLAMSQSFQELAYGEGLGY